MGDVLKLLELLKGKANHGWIALAILAVLIVLLYEVSKQLLPKLFERLVAGLGNRLKARSSRRKSEADIQNFCRVTRRVNWANSLPSLSRYGLDIPISDVFVTPKLALHSGTGIVNVRPIGEVLSEHRILCITGSPSSGKSTLLNFIAVEFANETAPDTLGLLEARLPLCFDFKELVDLDDKLTIPAAFSLLYERHGILVDPKFLEASLREGRCALFLDGLDEAGDSSKRKRMFRWVIQSMSSYSETNRVIVTCRDYEWEMATVPGVPRAVVQSFSEDDALAYIIKFRDSVQSRTSPDHREAVLRRFDNLANQISEDYHFLASSPLLLTLAVSLLTLNISVPKRRTDVLATFLRAMLRDWNAVKGLPESSLAAEHVHALLEGLAYLALADSPEAGAISIDNATVVKTICSDRDDAEAWLDLVASQSGIISRITDTTYIFTNRRILEYLAARDLCRFQGRWKRFWNTPDWKEVFAFLPEIIPDKAAFYDWIEKQGQINSRLHAIIALQAALSMADTFAQHRLGLISNVRGYLERTGSPESVTDAEMIRLYIRADFDEFIACLRRELELHGRTAARTFYASWAVLSGNVYASECVAKRLNDLPKDRALQILNLALHAPVGSRAPIIRAAFFSEMSTDEISKSLVACGDDVLKFLISIADDVKQVDHFDRALRLISEFPDSNATLFLFGLKNARGKAAGEAGLIIDGAIERHFSILYARSSVNLVQILLQAKSTFYTRIGKRLFDIVLASIVLLGTIPLFLCIAATVKLTSPGPVFFTSSRRGLEGKLYQRIVFRTMRQGLNDRTLTQASRNDPRVTKVGAFLRRTSLDDLPTLLNVIRGEMSMVGPQPLPTFLELNPVTYTMLARFKPGLTGVSQLNYRKSGSAYVGAVHFLDLSYMADCTFGTDLKIIAWATLKNMQSRNAY